jgi:hypothetical protein
MAHYWNPRKEDLETRVELARYELGSEKLSDGNISYILNLK